MLYLLEILFALSPSYVVRFSFGALKLNLLEVLIPIFWILALILLHKKGELNKFFSFCKSIPKSILIFTIIFFVASLLSTLISPTKDRAFGQLLAYFVEPIVTFFFAGYILREDNNKNKFLKFVLYYIGLLAVYALIQYFTLAGLPKLWWGNSDEPKRALSIFEYPNAFALFITPLLAYSLPIAFSEDKKNKHLKWLLLIGLLGLLVSLSRGGWIGFISAILVFALVSAKKDFWKKLGIVAVLVIIVFSVVPNLRYRVLLPFKGEKSTVSRFSLWETADKMILSSPILGKGLNGFATDFNSYNTDPGLAPLDYPHNIFLNFWVETGLLGLISFLGLSISIIWLGWQKFLKGSLYGLAIILFMIALYVHGMADAPYFKNDLALVFWIFASTVI
jgi:putative inorganic carbon (HCO3(-)) transporter